MAIEIFKNKLSNKTASISTTLLKSFELYNGLSQEKDTQKLLTSPVYQDTYIGLKTDGSGFIATPLDKDEIDISGSVPIQIRYKHDTRSARPLIPQTHVHSLRKFITNIDTETNTLQLFVDELEGLRHQLGNYEAETDDAMINIRVYPTLMDYIDGYVLHNADIIDEKYMSYEQAKSFITNIYELAVYSNIKTIHKMKKNIADDNLNQFPDVFNLEQSQNIQFKNLNYYYTTQPISK